MTASEINQIHTELNNLDTAIEEMASIQDLVYDFDDEEISEGKGKAGYNTPAEKILMKIAEMRHYVEHLK